MKLVFGTGLVSLVMSCGSVAASPEWFGVGSQKLEGSSYTVACSGQGPSIDLARREALNSCRISAASHLQTTLKVKTLSVETEKSIGFHQEIAESNSFEGLNCVPEKESIEETGYTSKVYLLCKFDLEKAKVVQNPDNQEPEQIHTEGKFIENEKELAQVSGRGNAKAARGFSDFFALTLAIVPPCDTSILVRGAFPRAISCDGSNPMTVNVKDGDTELVVRASGYSPKTVKLERKLGGRTYEVWQRTITIILDPL